MMKTSETKDPAISADVMADVQIVADCIAAGTPIPPEVAQRVRERSERIRQRVLEEHGVLDIGVPAIREFRGELPLP